MHQSVTGVPAVMKQQHLLVLVGLETKGVTEESLSHQC